MIKLREEKGGGLPLLVTKEFKILILETTKEFKDFSFESSKKVERGKRGGGWITITNNKKVQNFELSYNKRI
jgi:hypothetical protein